PDRTIFLSDERMVPADSPNNNAENLMPMLRALGCEDRFIRVDTGLPIEHAAELFARDLEYLTHETTDAFSAHRADSTPMRSCSVGSMSQSEGMGGIPSQPLNSRQPQNPIDLGFLGMGSDGHTAGFFTPEQANLKSGALTLHTNRPDGMQGISVTPALFQRVKRIILLVTGESKRNIINTLLNAPATIPAGIALSDHPHAELWTDNLLHQQE
ncbi:MAG: 6-phosphogluconolactonase, partial [Verrucomicrobiota bacterium]